MRPNWNIDFGNRIVNFQKLNHWDLISSLTCTREVVGLARNKRDTPQEGHYSSNHEILWMFVCLFARSIPPGILNFVIISEKLGHSRLPSAREQQYRCLGPAHGCGPTRSASLARRVWQACIERSGVEGGREIKMLNQWVRFQFCYKIFLLNHRNLDVNNRVVGSLHAWKKYDCIRCDNFIIKCHQLLTLCEKEKFELSKLRCGISQIAVVNTIEITLSFQVCLKTNDLWIKPRCDLEYLT